MLGYLGLPLLWKGPTDHFENAAARQGFWDVASHLLAQPHVVLAVNNPLLSEQMAFQIPGAELPVVRPHAVFANAVYVPSRLRQALLVSRTKFMWVTFGCALRQFMPHDYPLTFTVANTDSRLSYQDMASHRATVLVPWEHALMSFFEFYSMAMPLFMPNRAWAYRLVFDAEGNLGSTTSQYVDVSPACDASQGCAAKPHPHPPFEFTTLASRSYWYDYSSFAQFPHINSFSSIPELLHMLVAVDLTKASAAMKAFNDQTFVRSTAFWREASVRMLNGRSGCTSGSQ